MVIIKYKHVAQLPVMHKEIHMGDTLDYLRVNLDTDMPKATVASAPKKMLFRNYEDLCRKALTEYGSCSVNDIHQFAQLHEFRKNVSRTSVLRQISDTVNRIGIRIGRGKGRHGDRTRNIWVLESKAPAIESQSVVENVKIPDEVLIPKVLELVDSEIDRLEGATDFGSIRLRSKRLSQRKWFIAGLNKKIPTDWINYVNEAEKRYDNH